MAMYSWVPDSAPRQVAVEAVGEDALGLLGRRGVAADEVVEGALGVEHERPQLAGPGPVDPAGPCWSGSSDPRASASRLAGSMVTTQARRPRRAASRAKAAETVVLPTPPDPQQTTIDRSSTRSATGPARPGWARPTAAPSGGPLGSAGIGRGVGGLGAEASTPAARASARSVELGGARWRR